MHYLEKKRARNGLPMEIQLISGKTDKRVNLAKFTRKVKEGKGWSLP